MAVSDITGSLGWEEEEDEQQQQGGENPVRKRPRNQNLEERIRRRAALDPLKTTIQPILNTITQVEIEEEDEEDDEEEAEQGYKHPPPPKKRSFFHPSSSSEHAHFDMGENHRQNQSSVAARMAVRNAGVGEIVEVEGGHIVRSTGRKDRHSKVCTAKGPRDRRVRLSAHTAIKFYDVQDRLGYDRPSKAVDWLIKNAKPAIDELEQLPPWKPSATNANEFAQQVFDDGRMREIEANDVGNKAFEAAGYAFQANPSAENSSFLPPSLDSFFPIGSSTTSSSSSASIHLQSRQNQDLRLSLQSFQDPLLLQHQHHQSSPSGEQALFAGSAPMAFDVSAASVGWSQQEMSRGDPFSPVIHLPFVLGRTYRLFLPENTSSTSRRRLPSRLLDSLSAGSQDSTSQHEFRVTRSKTAATNCLLCPLLLTIEEKTEIRALPVLCSG
ncbi:hypothetical protein MRB53_015561 [Persea americana]|uniref:Uncharacterized protein n=1 Tax=Persea americana TaxID=3435 RepID=A0ACC2M0X4_PERAE|nr:hypothetical protein MRB53_015561 [Persea americana]